MSDTPTLTPTVTRLDPPYQHDWDAHRNSEWIDYHRNGVSGAGFIVALARELIVRFSSEGCEDGQYDIEVRVPFSYIEPPRSNTDIVFQSADLVVANFYDDAVGNMVGILLNDGIDIDGIPCAVFDQEALLVRRTVKFGLNSFRGDHYARRIIDAVKSRETAPTFEAGDRVVSKGGSLGMVLAQLAEWVWVSWEGDSKPQSHLATELRPYVTGGVLTETWQVWTTDGSVLNYRHEATGVTEARSNTDTIGLLHVMPDGSTEYTAKADLDTRYPISETA